MFALHVLLQRPHQFLHKGTLVFFGQITNGFPHVLWDIHCDLMWLLFRVHNGSIPCFCHLEHTSGIICRPQATRLSSPYLKQGSFGRLLCKCAILWPSNSHLFPSRSRSLGRLSHLPRFLCGIPPSRTRLSVLQ